MKRLKPTIIRPKQQATPQCCVEVEPPTKATMWRRERYVRLRPDYNPDLCQKPSTIEIDGKCYCMAHAGKIALEKWIVGDLEERVC